MKRESSDSLPGCMEIVLVEDDLLIRELMVDILEDIRANVVAFAAADDALDHLQESKSSCSLLITDHGLPGKVSGMRLAQIFRDKWPSVPVILTSGYELDTYILPQGVLYLQKPFAIELLIAKIHQAFSPAGPVTPIHHGRLEQ